MRLRIVLPLALAFALTAQPPPRQLPDDKPEETRLPNGKLQRDEILKDEYQKSLADSRDLAKLADDLKSELEKGDRNILSIAAIKKTEEIEKLARRIRDRMKH